MVRVVSVCLRLRLLIRDLLSVVRAISLCSPKGMGIGIISLKTSLSLNFECL